MPPLGPSNDGDHARCTHNSQSTDSLSSPHTRFKRAQYVQGHTRNMFMSLCRKRTAQHDDVAAHHAAMQCWVSAVTLLDSTGYHLLGCYWPIAHCSYSIRQTMCTFNEKRNHSVSRVLNAGASILRGVGRAISHI